MHEALGGEGLSMSSQAPDSEYLFLRSSASEYSRLILLHRISSMDFNFILDRWISLIRNSHRTTTTTTTSTGVDIVDQKQSQNNNNNNKIYRHQVLLVACPRAGRENPIDLHRDREESCPECPPSQAANRIKNTAVVMLLKH